jgi:hypothetical protein
MLYNTMHVLLVCLLTVKQDLSTSDGVHLRAQLEQMGVSGGRREGSFLRRLYIYNTMCYLCAFSLSSRISQRSSTITAVR